MANIKPILSGTKIALEKEASDLFGAAVEDFARGALGRAPQDVPSNKAPTDEDFRKDGSFYSSSYAAALSGGTSYRPKLKFLFKVEFIFTEEAKAMFPNVLGAQSSQDFTFMIKSVDRPKIDFEYEDDVNMYNFRTKVLKKIRHRELTMTFMDDTGNRVLDFFRALMMIHSPITRRQLMREQGDYVTRTSPPDANSISAGNGMLFDPGITQNDNAIRGTINSPVGNAIQTIRIKQMYVDPGEKIGNAMQEVIFDFLNARLVSFDLDDLSHEASDVNIMTMQFDYDWMEIVKVGAMQGVDGPHYNITVPGVNGISVDVSPVGIGSAVRGTGSSTGPARFDTTTAGGGNGFANILTNQLGRATQTITSTAVGRAVQSIAGKGQFASLIGSQASNILGGVVGAASRSLATGVTNSVVDQAAAGVGTAFTGFKNLIVSPNRATETIRSVFDSATGGQSDVVAVVTQKDE